MPRGTTLRNIRVDNDRWQAFGEKTERDGTDRSAMIRDWIDAYVAAPACPECESVNVGEDRCHDCGAYLAAEYDE